MVGEYAALIIFILCLGVAKLKSDWIRHRVPKSFISYGFLGCLAVVVVAALLRGADVLPGNLDFGEEARASNDKGIPITEHQESLLRPLLESMEISLLRDPWADLPNTKQKLKDVGVLSSEVVDHLTADSISSLLERFSLTTGIDRHWMRLSLLGFVFAGFMPHGEFAVVLGLDVIMIFVRLMFTILFFAVVSSSVPRQSLVRVLVPSSTISHLTFFFLFFILFFLPFPTNDTTTKQQLPKGHKETTAGRHDDGGNTWIGLTRFYLCFLLILRCVILTVGPMILVLTTKFKNICRRSNEEEDDDLRHQSDPTGVSLRRIFLSVRRIVELCFALLFVGLGMNIFFKAPTGWLFGIPSDGETWEESISAECAAE